MLADRVDAIREIVTDPDGTIRNRNDYDIEPEEDAVAGDSEVVDDTEQAEAVKAWGTTRTDFVNRMTGIFSRDNTRSRGILNWIRRVAGRIFNREDAGAKDELRAKVQLRSDIQKTLRELGQQAYLDGARDAGVQARRFDQLGQRAQERFRIWLSEQTEFINKVIDAPTPERAQATPEQARRKAEAWANMSLRDIYMQAKLSSNEERLLQWSLGATEEHCDTCLALHGQVHRAADWRMSGFRPGSRILLCNGFNCDCKLFDAPDGAEVRGTLEGVPRN